MHAGPHVPTPTIACTLYPPMVHAYASLRGSQVSNITKIPPKPAYPSCKRSIVCKQDGAKSRAGSDQRLQQVVQVKTHHAIPSFTRPWQGRNDAYSSASAFVVAVGQQKLLCTTAGAVEHARKVKVRKVGQAQEHEVRVAAVCLDADVALLSCKSPHFFDDMEAVKFQAQLPALQEPVTLAGFPIGGESFCLTSGVLSRVEVVEYSHSARSMLALQVDAAMNNGVWGGPLFDTNGHVVGMAMQKASTQVWAERYDEDGLLGGLEDDDASDEDSDEESDVDEGEFDGDDQDEDGGGANMGYAVPALLLQHVLEDYSTAVRQAAQALQGTSSTGRPGTAGSGSARGGIVAELSTGSQGNEFSIPKVRAGSQGTAGSGLASDSSNVDGKRPDGSGSRRRMHSKSSFSSRCAQADEHGFVSTDVDEPAIRASRAGAEDFEGGKVMLAGMPYLGVRWQHLESPVLRESLGLRQGQTGILITAVDSSGTGAAGVSSPPSSPVSVARNPAPAALLPLKLMGPPSPATTKASQEAAWEEWQPRSVASSSSSSSGGSSSSGLRQGDVLLSLQTADGEYSIGCEGSITLDSKGGSQPQKVLFGHCTSVRHVGETVGARVLRGGQVLDLKLMLRNPPQFIPTALGQSTPSYIILAGLVLLQFCLPLLHTNDLSPQVKRQMGQSLPSWSNGYDLGTLAALDRSMPVVEGEQVVVSCEFLPGCVLDETHGEEVLGYPFCTGREGEMLPRRLVRMNGQPVLNLQDVAERVVHATNCLVDGLAQSRSHQVTPRTSDHRSTSELNVGMEKQRAAYRCTSSSTGPDQKDQPRHLRLEFSDGYLILLDTASLKQDTRAALAQHGIRDAMSSHLQPNKGCWPFEGSEKLRSRQAMQKRQQRRRISIRR